MKTIGLIGGMSWESTLSYYRQINETVKERLGGLHSAKLILHSVDFAEVAELQRSGDWQQAGELLALAASSLALAGAQCVIICANTMHIVASAVEAAVNIPLLHVTDSTAAAVKKAGFSRVGLLGTRFTMEEAFYRDRLAERHGLGVVIPEAVDREIIHRMIYDELCLGKILPQSRVRFCEIAAKLQTQGAEALILGCTEFSLLVEPTDVPFPLFDTMSIHARHAAEWALAVL